MSNIEEYASTLIENNHHFKVFLKILAVTLKWRISNHNVEI